MSDERFARSADMRLLELQCEALGTPRHVLRSTVYTDPDPLTAALPDDDESATTRGTVLVALIDAQPRKELIAGALVTVSLSIGNDGDAAAQNVRASIALPADTVYRLGSFVIDGVAANDDLAGDLFANGTDLGEIRAGARRTLAVKVVVEPGLRDIILAPHVTASTGAILGLRAMRLTRGTPPRATNRIERPFYESDDTEHALEPLAPRMREATVEPPEFPQIVERTARIVADPVVVPEPPALQQPPAPVDAQPPPRVQTAIESVEAPPAKSVVPTVRSGNTQLPRKPELPALVEPPVEPVAQPAASTAEPAVNAPPLPEPTAPREPSITAIAKTIAKAKPKQKTKSEPKMPEKLKAKPKAEALSSRPMAQKEHLLLLESPAPQHQIAAVPASDLRLAGKGGPILTVRIDRTRLATLARLFNGPSLGMIAHYFVLNAIATVDALPGDGNDKSIAAFVAQQEQLLSRALIATRLGKQAAANAVAAALPPFPPAVASHADGITIETPAVGEALLIRAFQPNEMLFLERMITNANAPLFLRAAQLFIGLCGNEVVVAFERDRQPARRALTEYVTLATTEISRIFLRAKLTGSPAFFEATDSALDGAARSALDELGKLIA